MLPLAELPPRRAVKLFSADRSIWRWRIVLATKGAGDVSAEALLFLVGDAFVTGQTLGVNGGALFL